MNEIIYKGLNGVCVDTTELSKVDGENCKLIYLGYNIDELVNCTFEEIMHLFLYSKLPNYKNLDALKKNIKDTRDLPSNILKFIEESAKLQSPMATLRTSISMLSSTYSSIDTNDSESFTKNAIHLIFHTSIICAAICRVRMGKNIMQPNRELSFTSNFLYMLLGKKADDIMIQTLDLSFILHIDHSFNASTFTARVVASTQSDMISAVTAAVGALKGPLHGGANTAVMKMLKEINDISNVEIWLKNALKNKQKIMGFGHRVYKGLDPRAKHLKKMSHSWGNMSNNVKWFDMSNKLEKLIFEEKKLNANVDFYSASTYYSMGIDIENYTMLFALARMVGWLSHVKEQNNNNRIIRPKAKYIGQTNRIFINIENRD